MTQKEHKFNIGDLVYHAFDTTKSNPGIIMDVSTTHLTAFIRWAHTAQEDPYPYAPSSKPIKLRNCIYDMHNLTHTI